MNRYMRRRTFGHLRQAKFQISLRIRAVWSESSLGAFWIALDAKFLRMDNEDSSSLLLQQILFSKTLFSLSEKIISF